MPNEKTPPTPEELRALLRYEPETGKLYWLTRPAEMFPSERAAKSWNTRFANAEAFTADDGQGYRQGKIHDRKYLAHRVAYAMHYGEWPPEQIDHINGSRVDNRLSNLRAVSNLVNHRNEKMRSTNTSGVNGVHWSKRSKKWVAKIDINGKRKHVGLFGAFEDAVAARKSAEEGLGFTERHGLPVEETTT